MDRQLTAALVLGCALLLNTEESGAQQRKDPISGPVKRLTFDGRIDDVPSHRGTQQYSFTKGVDQRAILLKPDGPSAAPLSLDFESSSKKDFSVQFWIRTSMGSEESGVILSKKQFPDKSLTSQKNPGWVFYLSGGAWAWNLGSGKLRITHERDNGNRMPLNDDKWHQLAMTYDHERSEVRLFYDGHNQAIYRLSDSTGFDFASPDPLVIGWDQSQINPQSSLYEIEQGATKLQQLVDEFNRLGLAGLRPDEFESVIVDPRELFQQKVNARKQESGRDSITSSASYEDVDLSAVLGVRAELMDNPYTIHQVRDFMEVAPLLKIYSLVNGKIIIDRKAAGRFAAGNTLTRPAFAMDNLFLWDRVLSDDEILSSYAEYFRPASPDHPEEVFTLTAAVWNIHHGGIHNTVETDGFDSRVRIAEMLKRENADIILMQETYSHGDFIAAELGYYFATSMDLDYLNQGTNISVLSRYPIRELYVPKDAAFMNVGCKVAISETQEMYVMSNWYGMHKFPIVYNFHQSRFEQSDSIPVLFGGDFNAVPHTDGGDSPASAKMMEGGFTDAYRTTYPDVTRYPGHSHENQKRIDQLYYKGKGLKNTAAKLINTWPSGFPSDHYMIVSTFALSYHTRESRKAKTGK